LLHRCAIELATSAITAIIGHLHAVRHHCITRTIEPVELPLQTVELPEPHHYYARLALLLSIHAPLLRLRRSADPIIITERYAEHYFQARRQPYA